MAAYARYIFRHFLSSDISFKSSSLDRRNISYAIYKKYKEGLRTVHCQQLKEFHMSYIVFKRRKTAEEKKSVRIIEYTKSKGEIFDVWRGITLRELAGLLKRDIQYVYDIFLNQFHNPDVAITDLKVLQQAFSRSGNRIRIIAKPTNKVEEKPDKDAYPRPPPSISDLQPRPPVVTVMGHVDHGKTTLLDALRNSRVVDQEFGGITQHIGAFSVRVKTGAQITFLDTPGHAAFSAMRARGANLTDIVILVVAADDGVMEQTIESVKMARQANVPILVAINKIDAPKADVERTEKMLIDVGIQIEKLGGDVQAIPISALKKQNLDLLTDAILLQAELGDIKGDPTGPVEAIVVESKAHQHRGKLCTVVVQRGTLRKGDILVADTTMARVRVLKDAENNVLKEVGPGFPAEVEGWRDLPPAGELVLQVDSEKRAKEVIKYREDKKELDISLKDAQAIKEKQEQHMKVYKEKLEMKRKMGRFKLKPDGPRKPETERDDSGPPRLNIILKADVDGSLEAVVDVLSTYKSEECKMDLVHFGIGNITQNDIELAEIFNGIIYTFNVDLPNNLKQIADNSDVTIKQHNVIYKLIDDIKEEINQRLPKKEVKEVLGEATVLQQFDVTVGRQKVSVAGCRCVSGLLKKSALFTVIRNNEVVYTGPLSSMRHLKNEVNVIKSDTECGLQLQDNTLKFEKDDRIICFETKLVDQTTDWDPGF